MNKPIYYYTLDVKLVMGKMTQIFRKRWYISTKPKDKLEEYLRKDDKEFERFVFITTKIQGKKINEWQLHVRNVKQVGETAYG